MPTTPSWANKPEPAQPQQDTPAQPQPGQTSAPKPNSPKPNGVPGWSVEAANGAEVFKPPANNNVSDIVQNMPNSDKLTASERWIYGKLPGFSQSTIGQALAKFGDSWAGKALSKLDIGAEGLERTVGLRGRPGARQTA